MYRDSAENDESVHKTTNSSEIEELKQERNLLRYDCDKLNGTNKSVIAFVLQVLETFFYKRRKIKI